MGYISKIALLFNTVRYLKPIQIRYRLKYFIRNRFGKNPSLQTGTSISEPKVEKLKFSKAIHNCNSYKSSNSFTFLNLEHSFTDKIDWNYPEYGRLWAYNLNYFEFLNQENITVDEGLMLIDEFIETISNNKVGLEPYPISLRIINWIRFFITHDINDSKYQNSLWLQLQLLCKQKEYHLLGNHLLENGFALLFGSYYFNDISLYKQARNILINELDEQILEDGAHFELSPMYHCLMTYRVLDCFNLVSNNNLFDQELLQLLKDRAEKMLAFMNNFTFRNGDIPLFNDAAVNIAPTPKQLFSYANELNLTYPHDLHLSDSGYRKLASENIELFFDIGEVGPTYQPGHAHADTLSFELHLKGKPFIVDSGTSTYEINNTRLHERSTIAHNTVTINDENSSEVWSGHRVAKRAKVSILKESSERIVASHDGYLKKFGVRHTRDFMLSADGLTIIDDIQKEVGVAHFHFSPDISFNISGSQIIGEYFNIIFNNCDSLKSKSTYYSPEFNKRIENTKIMVSFKGKLTTHITVK
jgi:uncharacterized heparinase superfamily protein